MKLIVLSGLFAVLALISGCATHNHADGHANPRMLADGGIVIEPGYPDTTYPSYGSIQAIYGNASSAHHKTSWKIGAGSPRNVGDPPAKKLSARNHRVSFKAENPNDKPPRPISVPVKAKELTLVKVYYTKRR
jgi:hypothetical protein